MTSPSCHNIDAQEAFLGPWSRISMESPDSRVRAGQGPKNASWVWISRMHGIGTLSTLVHKSFYEWRVQLQFFVYNCQ